jgi:hypothetical protein
MGPAVIRLARRDNATGIGNGCRALFDRECSAADSIRGAHPGPQSGKTRRSATWRLTHARIRRFVGMREPCNLTGWIRREATLEHMQALHVQLLRISQTFNSGTFIRTRRVVQRVTDNNRVSIRSG